LILLAMDAATPALAEEAATPAIPPQNQKLSPAELDHAITQTIHEPKYTWRMPRESVVEPEAEQGVLAKFFGKIGTMLRKWVRAALEWLERWLEKLFRQRSHAGSENSGSSYGWIMAVEILLYALAAVALAALVIFLIRVWRRRGRATPAPAEAISPAVDLADENIHADQLPEDGWTRLGRELLERGEYRLAMRAFYLASLAHLAGRNLIRIARFKSNRDYERELGRRAHAFRDLAAIFGDNRLAFERVWYGTHEVNRELAGQFAANLEKLKAAE
jgi:tetratricopeptide (TPR) repeat protein